MTIGEALLKLQAHWHEVHLDVSQSGATVVANQSSARRAYSGGHNGLLRAYEGQDLMTALVVAINGEGLGG